MVGPKHFFLGGIAAVVFSGAAMAADLPAKGPFYKAPPVAYFWDGWYVGAHAGYAWGDTTLDTLNSGLELLEPSGGFGGMQTGFLRHLSRNWVLGFEADISSGDINAPGRQKIEYFGTARTRLGYAQGPWLLYGTGGVAWAMSQVAPVTVAGLDGHRMPHVGWTAGVGIEYALNQNLSVRAEYLYADLDGVLVTRGAVNVTEDMTLNIVRLGVNYRFGEIRDAQVRALGYADERRWARPVTWTGVYIGAHGGYGFGNEKLVPFAGPFADVDTDGAFGGIQSGANWQFSRNWLIGIEADSSWGSIKGESNAAITKIDTLGTVRGRLGYVMDNWMLYGTAGVAWAHTEAVVPADTSYDRFLLGWTAGLGVEYLLSDRWSMKLEYLYTDFARNHVQVMTNTETQDATVQTIKLGINYRASLWDALFTR